jgi:ABC-type Mn2+/Zn2+ transport system permease subunit
LVLSFDYDLPSGPAIILLGAVLLVAAYGFKKMRRRAVASG